MLDATVRAVVGVAVDDAGTGAGGGGDELLFVLFGGGRGG